MQTQTDIQYFDEALRKAFRRKDNNPSTTMNPLDSDYYDLLRWEYDHGVRLLLCFKDGDVEIPRAQFQVIVRASATTAHRFDQKRFEFSLPIDSTAEDGFMGRIVMREIASMKRW